MIFEREVRVWLSLQSYCLSLCNCLFTVSSWLSLQNCCLVSIFLWLSHQSCCLSLFNCLIRVAVCLFVTVSSQLLSISLWLSFCLFRVAVYCFVTVFSELLSIFLWLHISSELLSVSLWLFLKRAVYFFMTVSLAILRICDCFFIFAVYLFVTVSLKIHPSGKSDDMILKRARLHLVSPLVVSPPLSCLSSIFPFYSLFIFAISFGPRTHNSTFHGVRSPIDRLVGQSDGKTSSFRILNVRCNWNHFSGEKVFTNTSQVPMPVKYQYQSVLNARVWASNQGWSQVRHRLGNELYSLLFCFRPFLIFCSVS